jgi:hypothetical protein
LKTLCAQKAELADAKTVPVASTVLQGMKHTFSSGTLPLRFSFDVECAIMKAQENQKGLKLGGKSQLVISACDVYLLGENGVCFISRC